MYGKCLMIQGTASSVGKSVLCSAFLRILKQDGWKAAPFKAQNMSLNSFVTKQGLEMGRAQVTQAQAAGMEPDARMNPVLLKPTSDRRSQVIVEGKAIGTMTAMEYHEYKPALRRRIKEIYDSLEAENDYVIIEGAGSPAEINLREGDIVNMSMAEAADAPVILVGDIDLGGVFASLLGTVMLLTEEERKRVRGIIINKFRGDVKILEPGLRMLEDRIHIPVIGVVPWMDVELEDEDSVTERFRRQSGAYATAHNGNIVNARELTAALSARGVLFSSSTDSELFGALIGESLKMGADVNAQLLARVLSQVDGAFSFLVLTRDALYACRDKYGLRPLSVGRLADGYAAALLLPRHEKGHLRHGIYLLCPPRQRHRRHQRTRLPPRNGKAPVPGKPRGGRYGYRRAGLRPQRRHRLFRGKRHSHGNGSGKECLCSPHLHPAHAGYAPERCSHETLTGYIPHQGQTPGGD